MIRVAVDNGDVRDFACDVLVLKYAQALYGADSMVASALRATDISVPVGEYRILPSEGRVSARHVMFVGTVPLQHFDYAQIRAFSLIALRAIADRLPQAKHIATTIHGMGYGLDEHESFMAQLAGLIDFEKLGDGSFDVTIVEVNERRSKRLASMLAEAQVSAKSSAAAPPSLTLGPRDAKAGTDSNTKPLVFVAMPFGDPMLDTFELAIQPAVTEGGFLCERVDMETFMGDILTRIKERIEAASFVVAVLTNSNPNVYLEVGYAWGTKKDVLFVAREDTKIGFDVRGHRCLMYDSLTDLKKQLAKAVTELK